MTIRTLGEDRIFPEAYIKVAQIGGDKSSIKYEYWILTSSNGEKIDQGVGEFVPSMNTNFIQQAYEHMKNKYEFSGATDV